MSPAPPVIELIKKHEEKIRYLFVGGWNTLFGYLAFAVLYAWLGKIWPSVLIITVGYVIGITNSYICYKFLVFKTKGNYLREYLRFYVVYGLAYVINIILFPIAVGRLKINPFIAQAAIVFVTVLISYTGHKRFSFKNANALGNQENGQTTNG